MMPSDEPTVVAPWFASLPISDPRCDNQSCLAFEKGENESQAGVSWASQFLYGHYLLWVYAVVMFIAILPFTIHSILGAVRKNNSSRTISTSRDGYEAPNTWDKAAAALRTVSYRRFKGRIAEYVAMPSLGVALLLLFFWVAATIMTFVQHPYYRQKRGFGSPPLAVRAGLMAFALMPVTLATAGKFNLVSLVTGLGHEKLNIFHRWTAYLMFYLSIIHTIPFLAQPSWEGGLAALRKQFYQPGGMEFTGTPPFAILFGILLFSLPPLRKRAYELFVQLHWLLGLIYFGLCFWHADNLGDSWYYLWATLAIWLLQIVVRWFGKTSFFQLRDRWFVQSPVTMTRLPENMVKLELQVQGHWRWEAGQHVFLRFLSLRPLDNHPFTIAKAVEPDDKMSLGTTNTSMVFYMRPHGGVTARIASLAESGKTLSAIVDGPYGTIMRPRVETRYNSAILVAGGGGISGVLPWLQHLSTEIAKGTNAIKSVTLVWAVKRAASISWVGEELDKCMAVSEGAVKVDIRVTSEDTSSQSGSSESQKEPEKALDDLSVHTPESLSAVASFGPRPDMVQVLSGLVGGGRTLVLGCGPESLKIDLSNAVAGLQTRVMKGEAKEIRLHTETFGW